MPVFLCFFISGQSYKDVSISHQWRSYGTSKRHPYNKTLVTNTSGEVPDCDRTHNLSPKWYWAIFLLGVCVSILMPLLLWKIIKYLLRVLVLGQAGRKRWKKQFFDVDAQASAAAYLCAARFVSWGGCLACVSFWTFPPSWGCPATCWLSQPRACFRSVLGALRQPCRHRQLSPPGKYHGIK